MTSLRGRLLAWLLGLMTVMGVLAGGAAYMLDRNEVDGSLDGQLRQVAMNVGDTDFPVSTRLGDGVALDPEDAFVVTIWDRLGDPHSSDPSLRPGQPTKPGYSDFEMAGERWRAYAQIDPGRTIQVAQRMVVRDEFATDSALRALLPIAALVPLSWILVGWIVGRVLRPLHAVTSELRNWGKSGTNALSLEGIPDEILPLALATNELVTRLQTQLEFRERFISDAAHELRTPLAALRLQARNLRQSATSPQQAELIDEMNGGVRRMSDMVGKLLQLARADASAAGPNPDCRSISATQLRPHSSVMPIAAERDIDIGVVAASPEIVLADPDESTHADRQSGRERCPLYAKRWGCRRLGRTSV